MAWWLWLLGGIALLGVEVLTPGGFYVMFFGVGALVVGLLVGLQAGGPPWVQWLDWGSTAARSRPASTSSCRSSTSSVNAIR
jgi:membrane protein implicated in regulation of membrane protease activity